PTILHQEATITTNLDFLRKRAILLYLIHDRITAIKSVIATRSTYEDLMSAIKAQTTDDLAIDSLVIKKNSITLSISSLSLFSIPIYYSPDTTVDCFTRADNRQYTKITSYETKP